MMTHQPPNDVSLDERLRQLEANNHELAAMVRHLLGEREKLMAEKVTHSARALPPTALQRLNDTLRSENAALRAECETLRRQVGTKVKDVFRDASGQIFQ